MLRAAPARVVTGCSVTGASRTSMLARGAGCSMLAAQHCGARRMQGGNRRPTKARRCSAAVSRCGHNKNSDQHSTVVPASLPVYGTAAPTGPTSTRQKRVLCYGDSNTVGFCQGGQRYQPYGQTLSEALAAAGTPCEVTVCGLCGLTSEEMDVGMQSEMLKPPIGPSGKGLIHLLDVDGPFDLVIIMAGTNDLGSFKNNNATQAHVARLHDACHKRGVPTVNLGPPQVITVAEVRSARQHLVDLMATWASKTPDVVLNLDSEDVLARSATCFWEPDGIHLSSQGSKELGRLLASKVSPFLGQQSPSDGPTRSEAAATAHHRSCSPVRPRNSALAPAANRARSSSPIRHRSSSEHVVTAAAQDKENLICKATEQNQVERAVSALQKMHRKRAMLQHASKKLDQRAAITVQSVPRNRVMTQGVAVQGPCRMRGPHVMSLSSRANMHPRICRV